MQIIKKEIAVQDVKPLDDGMMLVTFSSGEKRRSIPGRKSIHYAKHQETTQKDCLTCVRQSL